MARARRWAQVVPLDPESLPLLEEEPESELLEPESEPLEPELLDDAPLDELLEDELLDALDPELLLDALDPELLPEACSGGGWQVPF